MMIIRGEIRTVRTIEVTDRKSGAKKLNHYLQVLTDYPSSGNGLGDDVKLPDTVDPAIYRKPGKYIQAAVRTTVYNNKMYLSLLQPQPDGVFEIGDAPA
ncbi:MAG: hypothetical protein ABL904_21235 [Hyphomicrobiaceae bacterium]